MKLFAVIFACALAALPAAAQRHKLAQVNAETEEGKLLQAISNEQDAGKKQALMEQFGSSYAKHDAAGWVLSQLQQSYLKSSNFDKTTEIGEKLLASDPMDLDAAYANLKAAEGKKDSEAVMKWAAATSDIARKTAQTPKSADDSDDDHKRAVDYAKQVDVYTEYSLYSTALTEPDGAKVAKLTETLEQRNAQSQYLPQLLPRYAWAARQANMLPNAVAVGERAFGRGQYNEDLLLAMSDYYMQKKDSEKVLLYTAKTVEVLGAKPKPEGVSDADWEKKKTASMGLAYWMQGSTLAGQGKQAQADKAFRSALPLIKDNDQLLAPALFQLGLANYQMGKGKSAQQMADAIKFMQQCAAIKSPFQAQAQKNVTVMRKETGRAR